MVTTAVPELFIEHSCRVFITASHEGSCGFSWLLFFDCWQTLFQVLSHHLVAHVWIIPPAVRLACLRSVRSSASAACVPVLTHCSPLNSSQTWKVFEIILNASDFLVITVRSSVSVCPSCRFFFTCFLFLGWISWFSLCDLEESAL